jgi:hypothetical protein
VVPSPGLLDIGVQLERAGVDSTTAWEASEIMRTRLSRMADDLVQFFSERAGQGFGGHGEPEEIVKSFNALRPEGVRAVQLIFAQEMERSLRAFVERGGAMPQPRRSRNDHRRSSDSHPATTAPRAAGSGDRPTGDRKSRHEAPPPRLTRDQVRIVES